MSSEKAQANLYAFIYFYLKSNKSVCKIHSTKFEFSLKMLDYNKRRVIYSQIIQFFWRSSSNIISNIQDFYPKFFPLMNSMRTEKKNYWREKGLYRINPFNSFLLITAMVAIRE